MPKQKLITNYLLIGIITILISCSSSNKVISENNINCKENLAFKKEFFKNVKNIENFIDVNQNESFRNSLKFIGKYSKVSFESMLNYAGTYPYGIYESDKKIWLEWYEKNKCQNIEFKE